jgi:hypothetical protein
MAGAAARLEIEMLADIARIQRDMAEVKRSVGGAMDSVNSSLGGGARAMDGFSQRFGEFAKMAETSADRAEKAFAASFREIQQLAANSIKLPRLEDGGMDIGAGQARAS